MDNIKEWTSLPMPELFTRASCRKDCKRISTELSLMSPQVVRGLCLHEDLGHWQEQDTRPVAPCTAAQLYPGIHVYTVRPLAGGPEQTISQDDLLSARALLNIIQDVPAPDLPTPPEPRYPDQGEFWLGRPVSVDTATKPAPAPTCGRCSHPFSSIRSSYPSYECPSC